MNDDLVWRSPTTEDVPQIAELASRCDEKDGALETTVVDSLRDRLRWDTAIGDFSRVVVKNDRVVAAGWVRCTFTASEERDLLYAFADPGEPHLYEDVMAWLAEHSPGHVIDGNVQRIERVLAPSTPNLPQESIALYEPLGFARSYVEMEMDRGLTSDIESNGRQPAEICAWSSELHAAVRVAYNDAFSDRGLPGFDADEWERAFAREDIDPALSFVAMEQDQIVGFVFAARLTGRDGWIDPAIRDVGWIDSIAMVTAARGQGVATSLLESTMREMRRCGIERAVLRVNEDNDRALRVYRRLGFQPMRKHVVYARV